jgi:SAM-dependent methyltransferase
MSKWQIKPRNALSTVERRAYWERAHVDEDYERVWSMTADVGVRAKLVEELGAVASLKRVAIPGCGSRTLLERSLATAYPQAEFLCTDFRAVVEAAARRFDHPRVSYLDRDSAHLGWRDEVDAVVVVNSILSESDAENRAILASCWQALRPGGLLVGLFPTVLATVDIASVERSEARMRLADLERSSFYEEKQGLEQIFYTPLRLRVVLREAQFELEKMEVFFCDSPYFLEHGREYYGLLDDDLVIYEHLVVARKP